MWPERIFDRERMHDEIKDDTDDRQSWGGRRRREGKGAGRGLSRSPELWTGMLRTVGQRGSTDFEEGRGWGARWGGEQRKQSEKKTSALPRGLKKKNENKKFQLNHSKGENNTRQPCR